MSILSKIFGNGGGVSPARLEERYTAIREGISGASAHQAEELGVNPALEPARIGQLLNVFSKRTSQDYADVAAYLLVPRPLSFFILTVAALSAVALCEGGFLHDSPGSR